MREFREVLERALPHCDVLFGNETEPFEPHVHRCSKDLLPFSSIFFPFPAFFEVFPSFLHGSPAFRWALRAQEAQAYAQAVGWESRDAEFIAMRLSLVPMASKREPRKVVITSKEATVLAVRGATSRHGGALHDSGFVGGFLAALARRHSVEACCQAGSYAAAVGERPLKPEYCL